MAAIEKESVLWVSIVTMIGCVMMARFARLVGNVRMKYKITPPETNGPPEFIRALRAQQNSLEFFILFIPVLWLAGIFFHQIPASIAGALYLYHRWNYFNEYIIDAKRRIPPFKNSIKTLFALVGLTMIGLVNTASVVYLRKDFLSPILGVVGLK